MEHVRIATYEIKRGSFQELADVAKKGMLRKFQEQPGFIRFGLADLSEEKTCLSLSLWETRKDADSSVSVAADWVRENIADRVELRSNVIGDLAFYEGVPARV
jgi:heme-degrading monooxygenase HmoA